MIINRENGKPHINMSLVYFSKMHRMAVKCGTDTCNAIKQQDHNFTWKKQQNLTVISNDVKTYWLLLAGLMFEVAHLTCEVQDLRASETQLNLTTSYIVMQMWLSLLTFAATSLNVCNFLLHVEW